MSVSGHLGEVHFLTIVNIVAGNTVEHMGFFYFKKRVSLSVTICPEVELLDLAVFPYLVFKANPDCFPERLYPLHSHQQCNKVPFPPHTVGKYCWVSF